ncbi:hornerin-like [Anopheles ziemanni]|uniref:hornerin-like n=1 Tax=Anopheles coustani TaxID=139045 RepID=UPI0026599DE6|nr:hornerin-like [Anopheles coustani]XP_058177172.1 hornerin-like [Anopheles ziemanni]
MGAHHLEHLMDGFRWFRFDAGLLRVEVKVFVVLCALLVGGALGDAALGNYYKDVVREQHKVINEMNQNFTELERASEKLIDLGFYVGKHTLPPKTVKITKTVAVKVPVPFPVKVPEPVPVPVPVSKPVPVPVPTLVAVPVTATAQTAAVVVQTVPATSATAPTVATTVPSDAAPASSLLHPSTVQVQEYVQSFPIHSVYDAGDDYNPMEGNRLALAEHTASPTETTFSKQSPSSLQQLEEYQQRQHHHQHQQYHRQKSAQAGSHSSGAEQYHHPSAGAATAPGQYYGGAKVQATPHPAAKFGPESHAVQATAKPYGQTGVGYKLHTPTFARSPDTAYPVASGYAGAKPAPSAPSAEGYRFAGEQLQLQLQRGGAAGGAGGGQQQFGSAGSSFGRGGTGGTGAGVGAGVGAGIGAGIGGADAHQSYAVHYEEAAEVQATHEESVPSHFQNQETEALQAVQEAGSAGREEEAEGVRGFGIRQAGRPAGKGKEVNELTPRPFQTVRESYPRYEKPDFAHYHAAGSHTHHHHHHDHHTLPAGVGGAGVGGGSATAEEGDPTGSLLAEGFDHPAFKPLPQSTASAAGIGGTSAGSGSASTAAHRYPVPGGRTHHQKVSTAGYHHTHPRHPESSGEAHQNLRHQADAPVGDPFPFYHATKDDPHFARAGVQSHRAVASAGESPSFHQQRYAGSAKESAAGLSHHHHQASGYHTYTEHHPVAQQQHEHFGQKYPGGYGLSGAKPTVFGVPSDAHLYPNYTPSGAGGNHHSDDDSGGQHHDHHHHQHNDPASGKFHYHFHNVHVIGGDHQPDASEHHYSVHSGADHQHDGASHVTSYDPPASGNAYHYHGSDTDDLLAGASDTQEQLHQPPPFGESSSYGASDSHFESGTDHK